MYYEEINKIIIVIIMTLTVILPLQTKDVDIFVPKPRVYSLDEIKEVSTGVWEVYCKKLVPTGFT